jgi:hypothetical protein
MLWPPAADMVLLSLNTPTKAIDQTLDLSNDECNCTSAGTTDASFAPLARSTPPGAPR